MKIDSLVRDVYKLAEGRLAPFSTDYSVSASFERWFNTEERVRDKGVLYFSEVGDPCPRRLWYKYNTPNEASALEATSKIKFFYGDMLEELVLKMASLAGHTVERQQERVEFDVGNGFVVRGRIDAIIDGVPVDVKSVTKYSEEKFKNKLVDDPFGYYAQLNGYATALGASHAGFLTIQKELGHINYYPIEVNGGMFKLQAKHASDVVSSDSVDGMPQLAPVPQSKTSKNMKLCTSCSYCSFKEACWQNANEGKGLRTFIYSDGPVFLTSVVDVPRVPELAAHT